MGSGTNRLGKMHWRRFLAWQAFLVNCDSHRVRIGSTGNRTGAVGSRRQRWQPHAWRCSSCWRLLCGVVDQMRVYGQPPTKPGSSLRSEDWQLHWIEKGAKSNTKSEALTNLGQALKQVAPQPPANMQDGGILLSTAQSHEGWRKRILEEKGWVAEPPEHVVQHIALQERQLLQQARKQSLQESLYVNFDEVVRELAEWGNSLGLPRDWVPRAALRTSLCVTDWLVYPVVSTAFRLLVRPRSWGASRRVALFKRE